MNNPKSQETDPQKGKDKKKMALLLALIIFVIAGGAVIFLALNNKEAPPQASSPPTSSQVQESAAPPLVYQPQAVETSFEEALLEMDPYHIQSLGANPVYYYPHPQLDLAVDLRGHEEVARMLYVGVYSGGFKISARQTVLYERHLMPLFMHSLEWYGPAVSVEWVPEEELAEKTRIVGLYIDVGPDDFEFHPFQDGYLLLVDQKSYHDPDPTHHAQALYGGPLIDRHVVRDLIRPLEKDLIIQEKEKDAQAEWQSLLALIDENPAKFEWTYLMPPYSEDPAASIKPNQNFLTGVKGASAYSHYSMDLDGDGKMEHILHNRTATRFEEGAGGYWAIFTETRAGLRLIGFSNYGNSSLIYDRGFFYYLEPALYRDNGWIINSSLHPIPIPEYDQQKGAGIRFVMGQDVLDWTAHGSDLQYPRFTRFYPKLLEDESGGQVLEFYVTDPENYEDFHQLYQALPQGGLVFLPEAVDEPFLIPDIRDYLVGLNPQLPLSVEEAANTVEWEAIQDLPRPLTYEVIAEFIPYPERLGRATGK